jgi:hypothetical protein
MRSRNGSIARVLAICAIALVSCVCFSSFAGKAEAGPDPAMQELQPPTSYREVERDQQSTNRSVEQSVHDRDRCECGGWQASAQPAVARGASRLVAKVRHKSKCRARRHC